MKKTTKFHSIAAAFLLASSSLLAQGFTDFAWKGDMPATPAIAAEYASADAVIFKTETYSRGTFSGEFPYIEQLSTYRSQTHLKIQKEEALKNYKRVFVPRFKGQIGDYVQMREYDIRIRKADGKVIDLEVKKLPQAVLTEDDDNYESREDYYIYDIPDLAIGDEIETVSVIESKFLDQGRIVNLYQEYPTLEALYTISIPNKVKLVGNVYNGMPLPKITKGEQMVYSWTMNNLKAIPESNAQGSIFAKELPYFIYELNFDAFRGGEAFTPKNYRDMAIQYIEDFLTIRINKKKKVEEFYTKLFEKAPSELEKIIALNDFLTKKMQIVGRKELSESDGIDDYLTNAKTDYAGVSRIYLDFFERYKVEHYLAFAKDRFDGDFDINFLSNTQIGDYFFVFKMGESFFAVSGLNGINEFGTNLSGVPFYLVNLSDRSQKQLEILNFGDANIRESADNKQHSRTQVEFNSATSKASCKNTLTLTGMFSTAIRGNYVNASKADTLAKALQRGYGNVFKDNNLVVKTAEVKQYEVMPPYPFKMETTYELDNLLKKQADGSYVFNLEKWLGHNLRRVVNSENRVLDYYLPFLGSDVEDLILIFDKDIESSNIADFVIKVDNEYATYECKASQLKPNALRIESRYTIKHPDAKNADKPLVIAKEKAKILHEANKAYEKVEKTRLTFKLKP
jgi:hypothetical protein